MVCTNPGLGTSGFAPHRSRRELARRKIFPEKPPKLGLTGSEEAADVASNQSEVENPITDCLHERVHAAAHHGNFLTS